MILSFNFYFVRTHYALIIQLLFKEKHLTSNILIWILMIFFEVKSFLPSSTSPRENLARAQLGRRRGVLTVGPRMGPSKKRWKAHGPTGPCRVQHHT